jgi:hypothetical protein
MVFWRFAGATTALEAVARVRDLFEEDIAQSAD